MNLSRLIEYARVSIGQGAPQKIDDFSKEGNPFIRAGSLESLTNDGTLDSLEFISDESAKRNKLKLYPVNSVVFAKSGMSATKNRVYKLARPSYVVSHLAVLLPNEKTHPDYLRLVLQRIKPSTLIKDPAYPSISQGDIENFKLPFPPLDDQIRIATVLTRAERLIAKRKESIKALDELLKSIFLEMFGDTSQFEWKPIEQIADKKRKYSISSGPFGSNLTSKHYTNAGIIVLRGTNISSGKLRLDDVKYISEEKAVELTRSELHAGDVVIIAVGSSGQALKIPEGIPKMIMSQNFNKITPDVSIIAPIYLEYCINSKYVQGQFKKQITDTVRTFLSLTKIISISIPIPPLPLQNQFAVIVEKVESIKVKQTQSLAELENLYASLSQRAFKGELDLGRVGAGESDTELSNLKVGDVLPDLFIDL